MQNHLNKHAMSSLYEVGIPSGTKRGRTPDREEECDFVPDSQPMDYERHCSGWPFRQTRVSWEESQGRELVHDGHAQIYNGCGAPWPSDETQVPEEDRIDTGKEAPIFLPSVESMKMYVIPYRWGHPTLTDVTYDKTSVRNVWLQYGGQLRTVLHQICLVGLRTVTPDDGRLSILSITPPVRPLNKMDSTIERIMDMGKRLAGAELVVGRVDKLIPDSNEVTVNRTLPFKRVLVNTHGAGRFPTRAEVAAACGVSDLDMDEMLGIVSSHVIDRMVGDVLFGLNMEDILYALKCRQCIHDWVKRNVDMPELGREILAAIWSAMEHKYNDLASFMLNIPRDGSEEARGKAISDMRVKVSSEAVVGLTYPYETRLYPSDDLDKCVKYLVMEGTLRSSCLADFKLTSRKFVWIARMLKIRDFARTDVENGRGAILDAVNSFAWTMVDILGADEAFLNGPEFPFLLHGFVRGRTGMALDDGADAIRISLYGRVVAGMYTARRAVVSR